MMQWKKAGNENNAAKFISSQMQMLVSNAAVLIMPLKETTEFLDKTDMMTTAVFAYSLYGLLREKKQGREIVYHFFSKEDAVWFLGILGLDMTDEAEIARTVFQDLSSLENDNETQSVQM